MLSYKRDLLESPGKVLETEGPRGRGREGT